MKKAVQKSQAKLKLIDADKFGKIVDQVEDKLEVIIDEKIADKDTTATQKARLTAINKVLKAVSWGAIVAGIIKAWQSLENKTFSKIFKAGVIAAIVGINSNTTEISEQATEAINKADSIAVVIDSTVIAIDSTSKAMQAEVIEVISKADVAVETVKDLPIRRIGKNTIQIGD